MEEYGICQVKKYNFAKGLLLFGGGLFFAAMVFGRNPLNVRVYDIEGELDPVEVGGSVFIDLIDGLVSRENELSAYAGRAVNASIDYLGVESAIHIDVSADATSALVYIPSIGVEISFKGTSASDLENKIEEYFRTEGSAEIARFRKEVNKRSFYGVSDGNPSATTALLSEAQYRLAMEALSGNEAESGKYRFSLAASSWEAGGVEGSSIVIKGRFAQPMGERGALLFSTPIEYRKYGEADLYGGAGILGLSYKVSDNLLGSELTLMATPILGMALRGSEDLAAGGAVWTYGLSNRLEYEFTRQSRVGFVSQIGEYSGIPIDYEGFELDSDIEQSIVAVGIDYRRKINKKLTGVVSVMNSYFMRSAAMDSYQSGSLKIDWDVMRNSKCFGLLEWKKGISFDEIALRTGIAW